MPGRGLRRRRAVRCSCHRPRRRRRNRTRCRPRVPRQRYRWPAVPWCGTPGLAAGHGQCLHRVLDLGAGYPLSGADQRVPGMLAHVREVNGVDPIGDPSRAAQILPLDAGLGSALLLLASLVQGPDHQAAPATGAVGCLLQGGHREPANCPHRGEGVPRSPVQQPLSPVRSPVSRMLGNRPAVTPRQATGQRIDILACLKPRLRPGETRSEQAQQCPALPGAQARPYPGSRSRLRFCCRHTRMIARRLHPSETRSTPRQPGSP